MNKYHVNVKYGNLIAFIMTIEAETAEDAEIEASHTFMDFCDMKDIDAPNTPDFEANPYDALQKENEENELRVEEDNLEEIAKLVKEGFEEGMLDREDGARISWKIMINIFNDNEEETKPCPICGEPFIEAEGALSRKDNKTMICSDCGTAEALKSIAF